MYELTLTPFASLWVDVVGIQTTWFVHALNHTSDVVHFHTICRITCHIRQVCKLKMQSSHFRQNAAATTCPAIIFARLPNDHNIYLKKNPKPISHICAGQVKETDVCFRLHADLCMPISKIIRCDHNGVGSGEFFPSQILKFFPSQTLKFCPLAAFTLWLWLTFVQRVSLLGIKWPKQ